MKQFQIQPTGKAFDLYLKKSRLQLCKRTAITVIPSIIAPGWKRSVRIDSLGEQYTQEKIRECLISNQKDITLYAVRIPKRFTPLMELQLEFKKALAYGRDTACVCIDY
mgnify:CR=1 FL=1